MALGLAILTAMATTQQRQLMADRSALLSGQGANANPQILDMQKQGPSGLVPLWEQLQKPRRGSDLQQMSSLVCRRPGFSWASRHVLTFSPAGTPALGETAHGPLNRRTKRWPQRVPLEARCLEVLVAGAGSQAPLTIHHGQIRSPTLRQVANRPRGIGSTDAVGRSDSRTGGAGLRRVRTTGATVAM